MLQTVKVPEIKLSIDIDKLQQINQSGEGTIFNSPDSSWVIKIFHDPQKEQAEKIKILEKCFSQKEKLWAGLKSVATTPEFLARDESGKIVGYLMKNCSGWTTINSLYDGKTAIKDVLKIFINLHNTLSLIHKNGLVIGDLNGKNILYSLMADTNFQIQIVDTDSWTINRPDLGINYCPMVQDPEVIHPDHLRAQSNGVSLPSFIPKHDWWVFSYLLTKCLTGSDPFEQGNFLDLSDTDRRQRGLSAMHSGANLDSPLYYALYLRIGIPMKHLLKRWLSTSQSGIFPLALLESTMQETINCPNCQREINGRLTLCPYPDCTKLL